MATETNIKPHYSEQYAKLMGSLRSIRKICADKNRDRLTKMLDEFIIATADAYNKALQHRLSDSDMMDVVNWIGGQCAQHLKVALAIEAIMPPSSNDDNEGEEWKNK